jgi:hypothetical protein
MKLVDIVVGEDYAVGIEAHPRRATVEAVGVYSSTVGESRNGTSAYPNFVQVRYPGTGESATVRAGHILRPWAQQKILNLRNTPTPKTQNTRLTQVPPNAIPAVREAVARYHAWVEAYSEPESWFAYKPSRNVSLRKRTASRVKPAGKPPMPRPSEPIEALGLSVPQETALLSIAIDIATEYTLMADDGSLTPTGKHLLVEEEVAAA